MKKMIKLTLGAGLLIASQLAFALDLGSAKAQGLVGEQANGYLGVVQAGNAEAAALAANINQKRKAKYQQIANKNGTQLSDVEKLAGEKLIKRAGSGEYVKAGGSWQKR